MLKLRCHQSGKTFHATQDRSLLIGQAGYCECRLAPAQPLEAVIVRYATGWVIHDLQAARVLKNQRPVDGRASLSEGDQIQVGSHVLTATNVGSNRLPDPNIRNRPCSVTLTTSDGRSQRHEIRERALIGTSLVCDIPLVDVAELKARHCLVTVSEDNWFIIDLTGGGGTQNGERWQGMIRLTNNDAFQIEQLKLQFSLHSSSGSVHASAVALLSSPTISSSTVSPSSKPVPLRERESSETSDLRNLDTDVENARMQPTAIRSVKSDPPDYVEILAQEVFNKVKALHMVTAPPNGKFGRTLLYWKNVGLLSTAERQFVGGFKEAAIKIIGELLRADPWNRQLLLSFARMCDAGNMPRLCLSVLNVLLRIDRSDVEVMKSIARICLVLAEDEPRYFALSIRYWEQVRQHLPNQASVIDGIIRNIGAQQVLRRNRVFDKLADFADGVERQV